MDANERALIAKRIELIAIELDCLKLNAKEADALRVERRSLEIKIATDNLKRNARKWQPAPVRPAGLLPPQFSPPHRHAVD